MPVFVNNDRWNVPDPCDNLGSPYAVRDYFHVNGRLSRACGPAAVPLSVAASAVDPGHPCWGNAALAAVVQEAHARGLRVLLDVALNHFGHNYLYYDYGSAQALSAYTARAGPTGYDSLWDYAATFDAGIMHPWLLDDPALLPHASASMQEAAREVLRRCPHLAGDALMRATNMWAAALPFERDVWHCGGDLYLEQTLPMFYLAPRNASEEPRPSLSCEDVHQCQWSDVKFLYHHEYHNAEPDRYHGGWDYYAAFVRNREYVFRVLNYWVSLGIDGFRLDHSTDYDSGLGPNEWVYVLGKVSYYDWVRKGQPATHIPPLYVAEEYGDQMGMNYVVDVMIDGFVGDLRYGRGCASCYKDAACVEHSVQQASRFGGHTLVLRALETHDEPRLFSGTGFDALSGAVFWAAAASAPGTPMLLAGQELGEGWGLGFRRSDYLRSRFAAPATQARALYAAVVRARADPRNRALASQRLYYLRPRLAPLAPDPRVYAVARWADPDDPAGSSVVLAFHWLWGAADRRNRNQERGLTVSYYLPPELADQLLIRDETLYRLVDVLYGEGEGTEECVLGRDLKWELRVTLTALERVRWYRLALC
eukprot:TRINITY_DN432_c0_g1_i2.p1 TRINITY_DN432_c0_g1~~TRINITY_DN432_c0_g1_i2.p1  ORF type:complete len:593 (+),score=125.06 TRINITY_DN432_c0_g1_i2:1108-2886(+)